MLLSAIITFVGRFYGCVGIDIQNKKIVKSTRYLERQFKVWCRKIIRTDIDYTKQQLRNIILIFLMIISMVLWFLQYFLKKDNVLYKDILAEGIIVFCLFYFGFTSTSTFIEDAKIALGKVAKLYIKVIGLVNIITITIVLLLSNSVKIEDIININIPILILFLIVNILLFMFKAIPFIFSHIITIYFRKLIARCFYLDKPLSSFLRYMSIIIGALSFIMSIFIFFQSY